MTARPRHLFISHDFLPTTGGVATFYERVASSLSKRYDLTVLTVPCEQTIPPTPYTIQRRIFFTRWFKPNWLKLFPLLFSVIRKEKPSVIHVGHILPTGTVVFFLTRFFRIPYIVYLHGMDLTVPMRYPRKKMLMQKILSNASAIVGTNNFVLDVTKKHFSNLPRLTRVLPLPRLPARLPSDEEKHTLREKYHIPADAFVLLTVGRLVKRKGYHDTLRAVANLSKDFPKMHYVIVGRGPEEPVLRQTIHELGLENVVTLAGFVEDSERAAWYATADLFVMPATAEKDGDVEGFGIVFLEAASYGTPSIGAFSGGIPEAIQNGATGYLIKEHDVSALTGLIRDVMQNPEKQQRLSDAAKNYVEKTLDWKNEEEQLFQCLP